MDSDVVVTGILSGPGGTASNPTMVSDRTYQIILMISSTHTSIYTCTATILPGLGDMHFVASKEGVSELDITVGMQYL